MEPLSQILARETRPLHSRAERAEFMGRLLKGDLEDWQYALMLRSLWSIYDALEATLAAPDRHPALASFPLTPELERLLPLESDLRAVWGEDWSSALPVTSAAQAYAERIRALGSEQPVLVLAHAYLRYLGDLSGGRILGRRIREQFGRDAGAFYDFGPADPDALKAQIRGCLDGLELDPGDRRAFLSEAQDGLERHIRLFDELSDAQRSEAGVSLSVSAR